jgi:hypothetical protein
MQTIVQTILSIRKYFLLNAVFIYRVFIVTVTNAV